MRDRSLYPLFASISTLPGVGPRRGKLFERLDISLVIDLLMRVPSGVVKRDRCRSIKQAQPGQTIILPAEIIQHYPPRRKGAPYRVSARDSETEFMIVFFHMREDIVRRLLPPDAHMALCGRVEYFDSVPQMVHPEQILPISDISDIAECEPVYGLTAGITNKIYRSILASAISRAPKLPEWLDEGFLQEEDWPDWRSAISIIHGMREEGVDTQAAKAGGVSGEEDFSPQGSARQRLAYDELLAHQLALAMVRDNLRSGHRPKIIGDDRLRKQVLRSLPYRLTDAQLAAIADIERDFASEKRMLRLLQGDVGSGKTLVALMAMLQIVEAGGQAALMAPTELLVRQHTRTLAPLLHQIGVKFVTLLGGDKKSVSDKARAAVASGEVAIAIGTHVLFQEGVVFADLRLNVIDEQHRFGVGQRLQMVEKGAGKADLLAMSATPIPRTLALAGLGFMDISILDEKPPGRKPITTRLVSLSRIDDVLEALARALSEGRQAFWVCPQIEDSGQGDLMDAEQRFGELVERFGAERVALIHGRIAAEERESRMQQFLDGQISLLVATTVVEVGVDVPGASIMIIEHAERFGLAQLHQLRGRVGRSDTECSCLLLHNAHSPVSRERLQILRDTDDGFLIAEADMRMRASGDLIGARQSGLPSYHFADLTSHLRLLAHAHGEARRFLAKDPFLKTGKGQKLRLLLELYGHEYSVGYIGSG